MSSATITCGKCSHTASVDDWCRAQHPFTYRCPSCGRIERVIDEPPTRHPNGFIMPGKRTVVIV
jgi:hypothetical protein